MPFLPPNQQRQSTAPSHLKHVATLPCEIWMPENRLQSEYELWLMVNYKVIIVKHYVRRITSLQIYHSTCCWKMPSVLWHFWLGGRKGIRPVKNEWWSAGMVICLKRCADLHMAQLMLLPLTVSCFSKIQIGFTFLVPAYPSSPGKRAVKRVCVLLFREFLKSMNIWQSYGQKWLVVSHAPFAFHFCLQRCWTRQI